MKLVSASKEEVNVVDKKEPGFGAIHYIAQGKHTFKTKLLVVLAIYGNADLDLTTTHKDQVTALHLAVEVSPAHTSTLTTGYPNSLCYNN